MRKLLAFFGLAIIPISIVLTSITQHEFLQRMETACLSDISKIEYMGNNELWLKRKYAELRAINKAITLQNELTNFLRLNRKLVG